MDTTINGCTKDISTVLMLSITTFPTNLSHTDCLLFNWSAIYLVLVLRSKGPYSVVWDGLEE